MVSEAPLVAPRVMGVGTHHKTGTLWMRAVFRRLAESAGIEAHTVYPASGERLIPDDRRVFLFQWSSQFPEAILDRPDARILHVIRDPRDVLLSGMHYHRRAPEGGEEVLHEARDDLDGRSYQQHLNTLPDDTARLMFEMGERHARTLAEMTAWDYARRTTVEARYGDLIRDRDGRLFREYLRNLGLTEPEVAVGLRAFWDTALFGGLARDDDRSPRVRAHVTHGGAAQWRADLPLSVARAYAERHGEALVTLGYEDHPTAWLEELRHAAA